MNFTKLTKEEQLTILANVAEDKGIVDNAVEKDYWVSMVLRAIFSLPYAAAFVFKYGQTNEKYKENSRKSSAAYRKPITYSRASNFGSKNEM